MTDRTQYTRAPTSAAQFCRLWSAHVDALEDHLSPNTWTLGVISVVLIAYPIARIVIPVAFHHILPDVVRTVLNLM